MGLRTRHLTVISVSELASETETRWPVSQGRTNCNAQNHPWNLITVQQQVNILPAVKDLKKIFVHSILSFKTFPEAIQACP
jgi:hypothetical protein